jgi:polyphosphate glucokinase
MNILAVDIGGTHVKFMASGQQERRLFASGPGLTAAGMVEQIRKLAEDIAFDGVSMGYPGPVSDNRLLAEPANLAPGWVGFDFEAAFQKPVKIINDAAMQALGSYQGGKLLFLGLGTGLGTTLIINEVVAPMELAHLPYRKATFEDYVGLRGLRKHGKRKWRGFVVDVVQRLSAALGPDDVVLGGGNVKKLKELPKGCRVGDNANAFVGGFRLWK